MIYDINTGRHKGFAFVEFETPEAANMAIQDMQAAIVGGRAVKVGRPSNMGQVRGNRLFLFIKLYLIIFSKKRV